MVLMGTNATPLSDYLAQRGLRVVDFAEQLGVPYPTAHHWVSGAKIPRPDNMAKIAVWSGGAITANSFYPLPPAPHSGPGPSASGSATGAGAAAAPEGDGLTVANGVRPSFIMGDAA